MVGAVGAGKVKELAHGIPDYYSKLPYVAVYNIPADNNNQLVGSIEYYT